MEKEQTIKKLPEIDVFKQLYYKLKDKIDTDQELFNRDITELIPIYYEQKVKEGTLVNIAIRGEPGIGKSVIALNEMDKVCNIIERIFNKKINRSNQIASDQGELLRKSKDTTTHYTCMEVDEFDPLMASGANATTELKEYEFFSDLCRVYYLHRISCSPTKIADPNVNVVYDVMSKDKENKRTHIKILYRNSLEGRWVQLGVAWIQVKELLEKEWFKQYEKKKKARVDLLTVHGLRGVRELEFANVAHDIVKETSKYLDEIEDKASMTSLLRIKAINKMQKMYQRPISFIAEDEIIKPANAILLLLAAMNKISNTNKEGAATPKEGKEKAFKAFQEEVSYTWKQLEEKVQLYKQYKQIMEQEE